MHNLINLETFPIDQPGSDGYAALVARCKADLARDGMFNLDGFMRPGIARQAALDLTPLMETDSFTHQRSHNIYFKKEIPGLAPDHPALVKRDTINHTLCADQIKGSPVLSVYEFPALVAFLADVMEKPVLYTMPDPLARVNVMSYRAGEALNWHFDRSEFTTTLLLQAPGAGGEFEYDRDLRSDDDPNYSGVADLIEGRRQPVRMGLEPGTLNVFKGKNTAHRVTPVTGGQDRIITVFSYYENPGVQFSDEERIGFFGRAM